LGGFIGGWRRRDRVLHHSDSSWNIRSNNDFYN
jgi:hypothetical protein